MMNRVLKFILCLLLPLSVGALSGIATASSVHGWYAFVNKPPFNPPDYLFAPVWTVLYILMGISFYLILQKGTGLLKRRAIVLFSIQLLLNFCWSFLFFTFHLPGVALAEIILLWLFILAMILAYRRVSRAAAWLQLPYLLWVSFASILNAAIVVLN